MDELKNSEESGVSTVLKEKSVLGKYTEDDIFFVSSQENDQYYDEIKKLGEYIFKNIAGDVEQALEKSVAESIQFIAKDVKSELIARKQSLDCMLADDREAYQKHKKEMENSLRNMEDILQKNKENFEKRYQREKQSALEGLRESEPLMIKNAQKKIMALDYGIDSEKYADSVEEILKSGFLNLQKDYLSYFETMLKDNKDQLESQMSDYSFYMKMDCEIPENLKEAGDKTREIEKRLTVLNKLKKELYYELIEISDMQNMTETEQATLLAEQKALQSALENVQEELKKYPPYIEQYYEVQAATHDGENNMRMLGQLLDAATILIPGGVWANVGAKILNVGAKGAKFVNAAKTAEKLVNVAKTITESEKALKIIDTGIDVARIYDGRKMRKKERKKLEMEYQKMQSKAETAQKINDKIDSIKNGIDSFRNQEEEKCSIFDYLSIEHYFAKFGRKFDKPQILQIDHEYEQKYNEGKHEIEQRLYKQAEEEYKKRQELLDIENEQEQLKLRQDILQKKQHVAEVEEQELKRQLEISERRDKVKAIREHYSGFSAKKISEFCGYLQNEKISEIDKIIRGYINNFDFNICANINRQRTELEKLEQRYENDERKSLNNEVTDCVHYLNFLETIIIPNS